MCSPTSVRSSLPQGGGILVAVEHAEPRRRGLYAAWWHPGIVLAILSLVTLISAIVAARWKLPVDDTLMA